MIENILFQIVELSVSFVEAILGIQVNRKALGENEPGLKRMAIFSLVIAIVIWEINQYQLFTVLATIAGIVGISIASGVLCKVKIWDAMVLSSIYLLVIYIADFMSITIFGILFQEENMAVYITQSFSAVRVFYLFLSKGILFAAYRVFAKRMLQKIRFPITKMCMGVVLGAVIIYYLVLCTFEQVDKEIFFIWLLMLSLLLLGIYSSIQYLTSVQEKLVQSMAKDRNTMISDYYKNMIHNYQESQTFYHDLKNQHIIVAEYLKNGDYEKAKEYMNKLKLVDHERILIRRTGIEVLDILIECKKREAETKHIQVKVSSDPIKLELTEQEITALFGNMLDNAIEACMRLKEEERWIKISFKVSGDMAFIQVANSCKEVLRGKDGEIRTTKTDWRVHGLGMASMKMIVEKYAGNLEIDTRENSFTVSISFYG